MKTIYKTINIDGCDYEIAFKPEPAILAPYGFCLVIGFDGETILKNKYNNFEQTPYKEAVQEIVKYQHEQMIKKRAAKNLNDTFVEELEQWDGVIQ
jgi:hypothetical protein